jgi:hypothetical protein
MQTAVTNDDGLSLLSDIASPAAALASPTVDPRSTATGVHPRDLDQDQYGAVARLGGRSRGGLTTKIHMLADALRPVRIIVTPGQTGDVTQAPALLHGQDDDALLADKAYDSNALRTIIADMGAEAVTVKLKVLVEDLEPQQRGIDFVPAFATIACMLIFSGVFYLS